MPQNELRSTVLDWLTDNVPPPRLRHILGVEQTALELASTFGLNIEQAAWAGLLHDLAKYFPPDRLLALAQAEGLSVHRVELQDPHLLHAEVGALVARDLFAVSDSEILDAIRNHTLGSPGMTPLSCVVYVADAIEPNRGKTDELEQLRQTARSHLYRAVVAISDYSLRFLLDRQKLVHPRTIQTRNWFLNHIDESPLPLVQEIVAC